MSICIRRVITGELSSPVSRHVPATKLPARSPVHYVNFNHRPAIISRSTTTKCYVIEAVESAVVLRRGVGGGGNGKWRRWCAVGDQVVEINDSRKSRDQTAEIMVAATATVVLGVGNRVLYKLALVPLKNYPFFLAQLATFGYFFFSRWKRNYEYFYSTCLILPEDIKLKTKFIFFFLKIKNYESSKLKC